MGEEMTEQKITIFREAFELFDKDRDGYITIKELSSIMKTLGTAPSNSELDDMIKEVDVDGNGNIEFKEYINLVARRIRDSDTIMDDMREIFDAFDLDKDGYISAEELKHVMHSLGETISDEDVEDMIREADANADDCISFEEFYDKIMNNQ